MDHTDETAALSYAFYYLRARLAGKAPAAQQVAEVKTLRLGAAGER